MPRRVFSRRRGGRPIRGTKWISQGTQSATLSTDGSVSTLDLLTAADLEPYTDPTVVRIRGQIHAQLGHQDITVVEAIELVFGIIVVDENHIGAPNPSTNDEADRDWMWTHYWRTTTEAVARPMFNSSGTLTTRDTTFETMEPLNLDVDVRSMRRIDPFNEVRLAIFFNQLAGAPLGSVNAYFRCLVKE